MESSSGKDLPFGRRSGQDLVEKEELQLRWLRAFETSSTSRATILLQSLRLDLGPSTHRD
jgi:hypothetical protein